MRDSKPAQRSFGLFIVLLTTTLCLAGHADPTVSCTAVPVVACSAPAAPDPGQNTPQSQTSPKATPGCAGDLDMPLSIDLSTDPTKLAKDARTTVSGVLTAQAALKNVRVRVRGEGNTEIARAVSLDYDSLTAGQTVDLTIPVRFNDIGVSQVIVDVTAVIAGTEVPFGKKAVFNVLLRPEQVLAGREVPRHLQIRAVREDLKARRITQKEADAQLEELTKLEATFDQNPYTVIDRTPQELAKVQGLALPQTELSDPDKRPSARGGVNIRVRGLVQWLDENYNNATGACLAGTSPCIHPVYGMTVQVRDDETVGSEQVRVMATDTNGQYDTDWFVHDDGWLAGNPDIFVRFRTENNAIDVEDGCFLCGTYENDTAIRDEFPGGEIIENFTCANTGTGPACSVLTGLTWIALYAHNLDDNNWVSKIRADWPGDSGSSNYNCTPACRLNIQPGDKWDWDVLHHEYGHWVMDEFNFEDNPGGTHNIDACHAVVRGDKDDGMKLAWAEGWPTFFGTAGQINLNMAALNVPRVGDVLYSETEETTFSYSLEENTGGLLTTSSYNGRGEDSELAVQRVFWDLFDAHGDSRDTVSVSDKKLFDIVNNAGPHSLNAAWGPIRATLSNADDIAYGAILSDHLIGPTPLSPLAGSIVTQSNASFSWDANVGCAPAFAGNFFDLIFYKTGSMNKILTIAGLTATSYSLTPAEFGIVAAQGPSIIWAVEARNSASPATGPYLGASRLIKVYNPPANDSCSGAPNITDGTVRGTTLGATTFGQTSCNVVPTPDAWYSYQATCDGFLSVDTCGSTFDTIVSVYDACPGIYENEVECNRTCGGSPCGGTDACIKGSNVPVTQGQTYLIRVGGWVQQQGDFTLNVSCTAQSDACDSATHVTIGSSTQGSTVGALTDPAPTCETITVESPGVWYTVYGNGNMLKASLCNAGTNYDTKLSVYCGGCVNPWCRNANDDSCGKQSEVQWCSTPGAVHHILVHGFNGTNGDFQLDVTDTGQYCGDVYFGCFAPNNTCATALDVTSSFVGDNTGTTTIGTSSCANGINDVWYRYTPNCTGFLEISTCGGGGSLLDTVLSVHDGCSGREIACSDDYDLTTCARRSQVTFPVIAGEPLLVRVAAYFNAAVTEGTFPLSFSMHGTIAQLALPHPGLYLAEGGGGFEDFLFRFDPDGPILSTVGSLGLTDLVGLTFAPQLGLMYGVNDRPTFDEMVTVNLATGAASTFASVGYGDIRGLAFDPVLMTIFAADADAQSPQLIEINPFTGEGSVVGPLGFSSVQGLAFDPWTRTLFGADTDTDQLITIDTFTGAGHALGSFGTGFDNIQGLTFDTLTRTLYGIQSDANGAGRLVTIDPPTGSVVHASEPFADTDPRAIAFVPGLPDATAAQPYTQPIPLAGGCPRYVFANATGLPRGLSVSADGHVLGTPTHSGLFTLTVDIGDSNLGTPGITGTLPLRVRPANDDCADAISVQTGDTPFTTLGARTDGLPEPTLCNFSGDTQVKSDIWFCHTATCTGDLTVSLCNSDYDTKLALYDGCTCGVTDSINACNDDFCGPVGLKSELTIAVVKGQSNLIRVGGFAGGTGGGTLSISCRECTLDTDCNDGNLCTIDVCRNGTCEANYKTCDDANPCTIDDCSPTTGCANSPIVCDDQDACTTETCNATTGICDVTPISCDDSNACTTDACDTANGCSNTRITCDDSDPCTTDTCLPSSGCTYTPGGPPDVDCNFNGISDACDIVNGSSSDCNTNTIPDECDLGTVPGNVEWPIAAGGNGHRYRVVAAPAGLDWDTAAAASATDGGYLATITSQAENDFVYALASAASGAWYNSGSGNGVGPWLGGSQPPGATEPAGDWQWVTSEPFTFTNWHPGQPDNAQFLEHNLHFWGLGVSMSPLWNDTRKTSLLQGYVLEIEPTSFDCNNNAVPDECDIAEGTSLDFNANAIPDECENCGWIEWPVAAGGNGHYYLTVHAPTGITWSQAQADAASVGGYLASIHSAAENDLLFSLIDRPEFWWGPDPWGNYEGPWIGALQPPASPEPAGGWTWDGGEPWGYTNWAPTQPDNAFGTEDHAVFFGTTATPRTRQWNDVVPAFKSLAYIIETDRQPATGDCDNDCDSDLGDYRCFVACHQGPAAGLLPDCSRFDFDRDADVDNADFAVFQRRLQSTPPTCGSPIAMWHFNETPGAATARDSIGNLDGTLRGSAFFVRGGVSGNSIRITKGDGGHVVMGNHLGLTSGDYSIIAWVRIAPGDPEAHAVVSKHTSGWVNGYALMVGSGPGYGRANKAYFYPSAYSGDEPISTTTVNDGYWHQLVGVYAAGGQAQIYVDGAPVEGSKPSRPMSANGSSFLVGGIGVSGSGVPVGAFDGLIDEVRVYDRALTASEVQYLFDHPQCIPQP